MDNNAQGNEPQSPLVSASLLPTSDLTKKHYTDEEATPQFALDESVGSLAVPSLTLKFKEVPPITSGDSLVAIKSGVFAESSNTFDRKLDEIFHNYNLKKILAVDESESENGQIDIGQPLKRSIAILDFKTSSIEESPIVSNRRELKKEISVPGLRINKKISRYADKFLDKGIQVKILPSKIMLHQLEFSENLKLNRMSKCHERHCNGGACRCMRLTKHVRYVSYPRGPCCHFRLLEKLTVAISALNNIKANVEAKKGLFLKKKSF